MALNDCDAPLGVEHTDTSLTLVVTVTAGEVTEGVAIMPALFGAWTPAANPYYAGVEFEYTPSDASSGPTKSGVQADAQGEWTTTDALVAGKSYDVRYRVVGTIANTFGPWSAPTTVTPSAEQVATSAPTRVFTGTTDPTTYTTVYLNETWQNGTNYYRWDGASWQLLATTQAPPNDGDVIFSQTAAGAWSYEIKATDLAYVTVTIHGGRGGIGDGFELSGGPFEAGDGGTSVKHFAVSPGDTLSGTVGSNGANSSTSNGGSGTATTCVCAPLSVSMTANGGGGGTLTGGHGGAGGTASGGDTNTTGGSQTPFVSIAIVEIVAHTS